MFRGTQLWSLLEIYIKLHFQIKYNSLNPLEYMKSQFQFVEMKETKDLILAFTIGEMNEITCHRYTKRNNR